MAITKTYLYDSNAATSCANVCAWLQENAVPEYFDSVELSEDGSSVVCTIDNVEILKYTPNSNTAAFVITTRNGSRRTIQAQQANQAFIYNAYKCTHGIAFTPNVQSYCDLFSLIVTKNNNGETTVVSTAYFAYSSINNLVLQNISAVSLSCVAPLRTISFSQYEFNITSRLQFTCSGALGNPTYTPKAYCMPHYQNNACGEVLINGTPHLSNGYWCIED